MKSHTCQYDHACCPRPSGTDETDDAASRSIPVISPLLRGIVIAGVWGYRVTLGPILGGHCRFEPTCSQYMIDAVHKYGALRGCWRGVKRIARCHPLSGKNGFDPA